MNPRKNGSNWWTNVLCVLAANLLTRAVGYLLDVPSEPFSFREGFKTFAGWVVVFIVSILAVEALVSGFRRWFAPQVPPPQNDPYLRAVSDLKQDSLGNPSA
jgi:hypothetical protein